MPEPSRWSRPYTKTVIALVAVAVGVLGWYLLQPSDVKRSEQIARGFASAVGKEVGMFRRRLAALTGATPGNRSAEEKSQRVEELLKESDERIDGLVEKATEEIEALDGISLRTQDNRIGRIQDRARDAKTAVATAAAAAKGQLAGPR